MKRYTLFWEKIYSFFSLSYHHHFSGGVVADFNQIHTFGEHIIFCLSAHNVENLHIFVFHAINYNAAIFYQNMNSVLFYINNTL